MAVIETAITRKNLPTMMMWPLTVKGKPLDVSARGVEVQGFVREAASAGWPAPPPQHIGVWLLSDESLPTLRAGASDPPALKLRPQLEFVQRVVPVAPSDGNPSRARAAAYHRMHRRVE
jgi:hypothetical protein